MDTQTPDVFLSDAELALIMDLRQLEPKEVDFVHGTIQFLKESRNVTLDDIEAELEEKDSI